MKICKYWTTVLKISYHSKQYICRYVMMQRSCWQDSCLQSEKDLDWITIFFSVKWCFDSHIKPTFCKLSRDTKLEAKNSYCCKVFLYILIYSLESKLFSLKYYCSSKWEDNLSNAILILVMSRYIKSLEALVDKEYSIRLSFQYKATRSSFNF